MNGIQLKQVSQILEKNRDIPTIPKKGWLYTLRTTLGMTIAEAAKRANVSTAAWLKAEKREIEGTITLTTLKKFLHVLGFDFTYIPQASVSLESIIKNQTLMYVKKEMQRIDATMALEDQKTTSDFSMQCVQKKADDIYRSGNWKEIWK